MKMRLLFLITIVSLEGAATDLKMAAKLQKRCEAGVAAACFDHAKHLKAKRHRAEAEVFFRRACKLSHQPACAYVGSDRITSSVIVPQPKVDKQGRPCTSKEILTDVKIAPTGVIKRYPENSRWSSGGVIKGDKIISVNGERFLNANQIGKAFEDSAAVVNYERNGREFSLILNCK